MFRTLLRPRRSLLARPPLSFARRVRPAAADAPPRAAGVELPPDGASVQRSFKILEPWNDHSQDKHFHPTDVVWIDGLFVNNYFAYLWRALYGDSRPSHEEVITVRDTLRRAFYPNFPIKRVVPVWKEQGCFVQFNTVEMALKALNEEEVVQKATGHDNRIYTVQGLPFVEDLRDWRPSNVLHIKGGDQTNLEALFTELRQFGRLTSLRFKDGEFIARFAEKRAAIAARSCLHGKLPYSFAYARPLKLQDLFRTITSNTRLLAILLAAGFVAVTLLVIAPMRSYFVTQTLLLGVREPSAQQLKESKRSMVWNEETELEQELVALLSTTPSAVTVVSGDRGTGKSEVLRKLLHRRLFSVNIDCGNIDSIQEFLSTMEHSIGFTPSFSTLSSVRSYVEAIATLGIKREGLSDSSSAQLRQMLGTLSGSLYVLSLRYTDFQKAYKRGARALETDTLPENGSPKSPKPALKPDTTADSDDGIGAISHKKLPRTAQPPGLLNRITHWWDRSELRHKARKRAQLAGPHTYAVVVFDNFNEFLESMARQSPADAKKARDLLDMIVEWSSHITASGVAHVVFVSHSSYTEEQLRTYPALHGRINALRTNDIPLPQAKKYLKNRLAQCVSNTDALDSEIDDAVRGLGGRILDLEELVARVEYLHGATIPDVLNLMLDEKIRLVQSQGFGADLYSPNAPQKDVVWSPKQLWKTILALEKAKKLVAKANAVVRPSLDYHDTLLNIFSGNEEAVQRLVENELLSLWLNEPYVDKHGEIKRGARLAASSPRLQSAFSHMTNGMPELRRGLNSMTLMQDLSSLEKTLAAAEQELQLLAETARAPMPVSGAALQRARELDHRIEVLNAKIYKTQQQLKKENALKPSWLVK